MASVSFEARLERIHQANGVSPVRQPARREAGPTIAERKPSSKPAVDKAMLPGRKTSVLAAVSGGAMGTGAGVLVKGLTQPQSLWGPGTFLNEIVFLPAMAGVALAPILLLASFLLLRKRPGFVVFTLGYLVGLPAMMAF